MAAIDFIKIKLGFAILLTFTLFISCNCYDYLYSEESEGVSREYDESDETYELKSGNERKETKWPNGTVNFFLNSTLGKIDTKQVYLAIDEYHRKTCIRFQPRRNGNPNWISIEFDRNVAFCGVGTDCMQGGYQFAKVNPKCANVSAIIHELGHNLCLKHEHQRSDRDNYVDYSGCVKSDAPKQETNKGGRLYDYASQMHYECGSCDGGGRPKTKLGPVIKCGSQVTPGLSILDSDHINKMYNCQGCFRHRWIHVNSLNTSLNRTEDLPMFNITGLDWKQLYPCRAMFKGEIVIGKYKDGGRNCTFAYNGTRNSTKTDFEVLSIPGGLTNDDSEYYLRKVENGDLDSVMEGAILAGHSLLNSPSKYANEFIAYVDVTGIRCNFTGRRKPPPVVFSIGKAATTDEGKTYRAYFAFCRYEISVPDYYVLACRNYHLMDRGNYAGEDIYSKWPLRHMEMLEDGLVPETSIVIFGRVLPDATIFLIDLAQDIAGGPIFLHFKVLFELESSKGKVVCNSLSTEKWGVEVILSNGDEFLFRRGNDFQLEIHLLSNHILFKVGNKTIGRYPNHNNGFDSQQFLNKIKFLRVHGDVKVNSVTKPNDDNKHSFEINMQMFWNILYGVGIALAVIGLIAIYVAIKAIFRIVGGNTNSGFQVVPVIHLQQIGLK